VIGLNVPQMVRTETSDPMSESGHSRRYGLRKQAQGFALSKGHISRLWRQRAFSESVKNGNGGGSTVVARTRRAREVRRPADSAAASSDSHRYSDFNCHTIPHANRRRHDQHISARNMRKSCSSWYASLAIEQQGEPFGMGQRRGFSRCFDLAKALGQPLRPS
jgi:hypothetical protein